MDAGSCEFVVVFVVITDEFFLFFELEAAFVQLVGCENRLL